MKELIVKSISIVDYTNKTANTFGFSKKANLITSDENEAGKSSLISSIYYGLGAKVASFAENWHPEKYIIQIKCSINGRDFTIKRQSNIFTIYDGQEFKSFGNEHDFSTWLQNELGSKMILISKKSDKQSLAYVSALLTPFYIDQDYSWSAFYQKALSGVEMYKNQPKVIFEYLFGLSNPDIKDLESQIQMLSEQEKEMNVKIDQIDAVYTSYSMKKEATRLPAKNLDQLQSEIENYIKITNSISDKISNFTAKISEQKVQLDIKQQDLTELKKLWNKTGKRYKEISYECSYCHSVLTREQSLTRLELADNDFEISSRIHELEHNIESDFEKIERLNKEILLLEGAYREYNSKLQQLDNITNIEEYVDQKVLFELDQLRTKNSNEKEKIGSEKKSLRKDLNVLRKELEDKKEGLKESYEEVKAQVVSEIETFALNNRYFLDFSKVNGKGTALNKNLLALYLVYSEMLNKFSEYRLPLGLDSFIKSEITDVNEVKMFDAVKKHFLDLDQQTFFSVVDKNIGKLNSPEVNIIKLKRPILIEDSYDKVQAEIIDVLNN